MPFLPREMRAGRLPVVLMALTVIWAASISRAGSIFDDDYTPPKRETPKADVKPTPTPEPTPSPTPAPPDVAKPDVAPTPAPPLNTARRSIPTKAQQTQCGKLFNEAFSAQLNDQLISSWKTDYSDMSLGRHHALHHDNTIGVATYENAVRFDVIELIEMTGRGKEIK